MWKKLLLFFWITAAFASSLEEFASLLKTTQHTLSLESGPLSYTAVTGICPRFGKKGKEAELFFISYSKDGVENRPITFLLPGGPGGNGTSLAISSIGPRRLLTADEGYSVTPPYTIIDNPETLLEYTDLVFVDPPTCGYSQTFEEADLNFYHSVEGDLSVLREFIQSYLDFFQKWSSPVYLCGKSYGTVRVAALAHDLISDDIWVKGIILNGCAFELPSIFAERDHPLPDCLLLPTLAATAWYHGRLSPQKSLAEVVEEARRFAYDEYAPFLLQPLRFSGIKRERIDQQLSTLTGLPLATIQRYNSRINENIYVAEFFGPERKRLGAFDSRYSGDISSIDPADENDPSYIDSQGRIPAFRHYLQKELNTIFPLRKYVHFSYQVHRSWDWRNYGRIGRPSFLQKIRSALIQNPQLKILVAAGYYDCRTPFTAAEYCFDHLDLPASYRKNIQFKYYEAGHGFIFDGPSLKKFKADLVEFYDP